MTNTNDIVERLRKGCGYNDAICGINNEAADLIEQQAKDITAMVKQIALQETKINWLEKDHDQHTDRNGNTTR